MLQSLLDTDLYKFTMMQVVLHQFPGAMVEYAFQARIPGIDLRPHVEHINDALDALCQLRFQEDELAYLTTFPFFKTDFIDFLRLFQLQRQFVTVTAGPAFTVKIKGPWLHTILFEVPVLAIICETYFKSRDNKKTWAEGERRLAEKIAFVKNHPSREGFVFSDFGTRRRFSQAWHEHMVATLVDELPEHFSGTSNTFFAKKYRIKPIGTMAHEYIQACQSLGPRLLYSQRFAFEKWAQEYRGDLGIALGDTYGINAFLNDFDLYFCKLFDGVRQDSGDPFEWGVRIIEHYKKMRVDPRTKTLVFSDALTFEKALALHARFKEDIKAVFGIGTYLTNDRGISPIDVVIKMVACNGQPVAKVSDTPEKTVCPDQGYLAYLKQVFKITE